MRRWWEDLRFDCAAAMRRFARHPALHLTMVATIAVALTTNSVLFSAIQGIANRMPAGIPNNEALVRVRGTAFDSARGRLFGRSFSLPEAAGIERERNVFRSLAGWFTETATLETASSHRETISATRVAGDYFGVFGVAPLLGRALPASGFTRAASEPEAVISHGLWVSAFGSSADALGRTVRVDGLAFVVVGVAPPEFVGAGPSDTRSVVWIPLAGSRTSGGVGPNPESESVSLAGVLRADASMAEATAAVAVVARRIAAQLESRAALAASADVVPLRVGNDAPAIEGAPSAIVAAALIGSLILLIACCNVAALLAGAAVSRTREFGARLAIGASRARLIRQLLTESGVLAAFAVVVAGILTWSVLAAVTTHAPGVNWQLDAGAVIVAVALAALATLLFGLAPALHGVRAGISALLDRSAGGATMRSALQRRFVAVQIALSLPALVALAGLTLVVTADIRSLSWSRSRDDVVVVTFVEKSGVDGLAETKRLAVWLSTSGSVAAAVPHRDDALLAEVEAVPGNGRSTHRRIPVVGYPVSPEYFDVLRLPLLMGRGFLPGERSEVVIGSDMARSLWGSTNPVGARLRMSRGAAEQEMVVVGVFDAGRAGPSREGSGARIYVPLDADVRAALRVRRADGGPQVLVRTHDAADGVLPRLRSLIEDERPRLAVARVETIRSAQDRLYRERLRLALATSAVALLAVLLACIGVYGVVALAVQQRGREIGIRIALGATRWRVTSLFIREGMWLLGAGLALGLPVSLFALSVRLPGLYVSTTAVGLVVGLLLVTAILLASWLPVRRLGRLSPAVTLRIE